MSLGEPGANGRMSLMGLFGYPWAEATPANNMQQDAISKWKMRLLPVI